MEITTAIDKHLQAQFSSSPLLDTVHPEEEREETEKINQAHRLQTHPAAVCGRLLPREQHIHIFPHFSV
ncbi:hypothetical protein EXN66_Car015750 [Channa argus]|uniref:Uncharacterized protein n=1 Tax=Channa argus TaxID=215402 RepID=A0A6G1QCK8_CHAAH|nr:hypothetical protein EXN66_Car015750 [Channa argus]